MSAACETTEVAGPAGPSPVVTEVNVVVAGGVLIEQTTVEATALAEFSNGTVAPVDATWSSDNARVAIVNEDGRVTGISPGSTRIFGTFEGITGSQWVTIVSDYRGTWVGNYTIRECDAAGGFAALGSCDTLIGTAPPMTLILDQTGDIVVGSLSLGNGISGRVSGSILSLRRLTLTGTFSNGRPRSGTLRSTAPTVLVTLESWRTQAENNQLTGTFRQRWSSELDDGLLLLDCRIRTVVRSEHPAF